MNVVLHLDPVRTYSELTLLPGVGIVGCMERVTDIYAFKYLNIFKYTCSSYLDLYICPYLYLHLCIWLFICHLCRLIVLSISILLVDISVNLLVLFLYV